MTEHIDRRSEATRLQILRAASHLFARSPYTRVSLDDILADATVTKGAMYFHFPSKHALAVAIVELHAAAARRAAEEVTARKLSGLETLIDVAFLVAGYDLTDETTRAALNLLESIGRTDGLQAEVLGAWAATLAEIIEKAVAEGDVRDDLDPVAVARVSVSMYMGLRQTSDLDDPERFLRDVQSAWALMLPGLAGGDRIAYLAEFIDRRTVVAIRKATATRRS